MATEPVLTLCGRAAGPIGYGLLGLTIPWAPVDRAEATKLLKTALTRGANVWNGSTHYGTPDANSLHLLKHYFQQYPEDAEKVILTLKGAYSASGGPTGSPEAVRASVEEAYAVLKGIKTIDAFAMGRVDPDVSIEVSIAALTELVKEGKIGGIGLSEVSAQSIRKASAVHPISYAEIELSLFTPDPLFNGVAEACRSLSIPIVAYSPIGRGFLSGQIRSLDDLAADDFRRKLPRFQAANINQNLELVNAVEKLAKRRGCTTAQIALGWVVNKGAVPIPGSKNINRVTENCSPAVLTSEDMLELDEIIKNNPVAGQRYGGVHEKLLNA